jgi:hypothetical protein
VTDRVSGFVKAAQFFRRIFVQYYYLTNSRKYVIIIIESEGTIMEDKLRRFNEALEQAKRECCIWCPCAEGCNKIPEEDNTPCETILFLYVETGETENFSKYFQKNY